VEIGESEIQQEVLKLKNLKGLAGKNEQELNELATDKIRKRRIDIDVNTMFSSKSEKARGKELLWKYMDDYSIDTISDKNSIREVIYLEIVQQRLQEKLNEFYEQDQKAVPTQLIDTIHKNSDAILKLKNSLGLNKGKQGKSTYDALVHLKKRFKRWREENQGSRTIICPHCGKMVILKLRTKFWEAAKHPFFKDKVLFNTHLFKLFKENKLSRDDCAKVLECSPDYINWIVEKSRINEHTSQAKEKAISTGEEN